MATRAERGFSTSTLAQAGPITIENAWTHVYRLLLWIDRTTGLAHCYESDKAQPGRHWYARALSFHHWLAKELATTPRGLAQGVDWLFKEAVKILEDLDARRRVQRAEVAAEQIAPYADQDFPRPGEDPEVEQIALAWLSPWLSRVPEPGKLAELIDMIWRHRSNDAKRKNLVGEGFEDVLACLVRQLGKGLPDLSVLTRPLLHELPGFGAPRTSEKPRKVDLAIIHGGRRHLVSVKWSIRADREEQFGSDFEAYARLESAAQDFEYVLVTNEFDAARLLAACERRHANAFLFKAVVHVNTEGVAVVYRTKATPAWRQLEPHRERLQGLGGWLRSLLTPKSAS